MFFTKVTFERIQNIEKVIEAFTKELPKDSPLSKKIQKASNSLHESLSVSKEQSHTLRGKKIVLGYKGSKKNIKEKIEQFQKILNENQQENIPLKDANKLLRIKAATSTLKSLLDSTDIKTEKTNRRKKRLKKYAQNPKKLEKAEAR